MENANLIISKTYDLKMDENDFYSMTSKEIAELYGCACDSCKEAFIAEVTKGGKNV